MGWSHRPNWGQQALEAPGCPDCARHAAQAARWQMLREHWWGPLAAAALGATIGLGGMALQRAPGWMVPVMAVSGAAVALVGPPQDTRCDVHRSVCPACGGAGRRPPAPRNQGLVIWGMHAAGAGLGLGVAVLFAAVHSMLTPHLFSGGLDLFDLAFLALLPVAGWFVVGGMAKSRVRSAQAHTMARWCPACGHRWTLGHVRARSAAI